jgi:hypothetical protein
MRQIFQWAALLLFAFFNWRSGAPLTFAGARASFNSANEGPIVVGVLPKSTGKVTITSTPGVVTYFNGFALVDDPDKTTVTPMNSTSQSNSELAVTDTSGKLLFINPKPGQLSNLTKGYLRGPSSVGLDMNLMKRVRTSETKKRRVPHGRYRYSSITQLGSAEYQYQQHQLRTYHNGDRKPKLYRKPASEFLDRAQQLQPLAGNLDVSAM